MVQQLRLHFHYSGHRLDPCPGWGTKSLQATGCGQTKKKKKTEQKTSYRHQLRRKRRSNRAAGGAQSSVTLEDDLQLFIKSNVQPKSPLLGIYHVMHWRRKWHPTPVFLPGESRGRGSLVGCRLWGRTDLDTTEAIQQQQHIQNSYMNVCSALFITVKNWKLFKCPW